MNEQGDDFCWAQIHGGLWAWPCLSPKGHPGEHSWEGDLRGGPCVCHAWVNVTAFGDPGTTYQSTDGSRTVSVRAAANGERDD